jgi:cobalt-zinc-cadmium efflux system outer membrane protein
MPMPMDMTPPCLPRVLILTLALLAWGCQHYEPIPLSPVQKAADLDARNLANPDLRPYLEAKLGKAFDHWPLRRWDLRTLTLAAFYYHPDLEVARARLGIAAGRVKTAGARPNPVISASPEYATNPGSGVSPWVAMGQVDWPIETAGKRGHRIARAEAQARAARLAVLAEAWKLRGALQAALVDYAAAKAKVPVMARMAETESRLVHLLEERVEAGAASREDLLPYEVASIQAQADLAAARRVAGETRARLAAAIGISEKALDGVAITFPLDSADGPGRIDSDAIHRQALLGRADVLAALADYAASQAALQLEIARQYPDLHISNGYQFDQGQNKWALGLSMELPLLDRNQGPIAEAIAARRESAARFDALQAQVLAEIEEAVASHTGALAQLRQAEAVVREQRDRMSRIEVSFEAGAADAVARLGGELDLERSELTLLEARRLAAESRGRLETAVQRPNELFGLDPAQVQAMKTEDAL